MSPMIQSLLKDRFRLTAHRVTKEMPVYASSATKKGAKLHDADGTNSYGPKHQLASTLQCRCLVSLFKPVSLRCGGFYVLNGYLEARKVSVQELAQTLSRMDVLGRRALDQTGITGRFDIDLQWSPDARPAATDRYAST